MRLRTSCLHTNVFLRRRTTPRACQRIVSFASWFIHLCYITNYLLTTNGVESVWRGRGRTNALATAKRNFFFVFMSFGSTSLIPTSRVGSKPSRYFCLALIWHFNALFNLSFVLTLSMPIASSSRDIIRKLCFAMKRISLEYTSAFHGIKADGTFWREYGFTT